MKNLHCLTIWGVIFFVACLQVLFAQNTSPSPEAGLHIKKEITVGDILTLLTIAISLIGALLGLMISSYKDRQFRRKEYADKIRRAAGTVIAKLERWKELSLRYFDDVQPMLTDTDVRLIKKGDMIDARDFLWRNLVAARANSTLRIVKEEIEIAYSDLSGYDPKIHAIYVKALGQLKNIDHHIYDRVLKYTQRDVFEIGKKLPEIQSADLGNALRSTCGDLAAELEGELSKVISWFRNEMLKLIEAGDKEIVERRIEVSNPDMIGSDVSNE